VPGLVASPPVILGAFAFQTIFLFSLVVCCDHKRSNKFRKADKNKAKIEQPQLEINDDVKQLEEEIVSGTDQDKWLIKANDLHKIYPGKGLHAVCGNTFGVEKGTVMGLLGPNGAGKSTTFGMLSMAFPRSSGSIEMFDSQIENVNLKKYGQYIGMCPQHNTIWENLTV
jgi:ABC-type transport system involved in cytochrome bd biosynthesis fused ATPase/permease subunit